MGAVTLSSSRAPYSNFGASLDVTAPGGDFRTDRPGDMGRRHPLNLGIAETEATLDVSNGGGGTTVVTDIEVTTDDGDDWLGVSAESTDANGLGSYRVTVDRNRGRADGIYTGVVRWVSAGMDEARVPVIMQLGSGLSSSGDAGFHCVLLVGVPKSRRRRARAVMRSAACVGVMLVAFSGSAVARDRGADGTFSERRSRNFVLRQDVAIDRYSGHRGIRRFELTVLELLERAHDGLRSRLGLATRYPVEVVVYDPAVFDREFAGLFPFPAGGFFHGVIRIRGGVAVDAALRHLLHHELVHAALAQAEPSFAVPAWVNEGLAEWFAHRSVGKRGLSGGEASALSEAALRGSLPSLASLSGRSFAALSPRSAQLAYLTSYAAVDQLADHYGEDRLEAFVALLLRTRHLERALRKTYRLSLAELDESLCVRFSGQGVRPW